MFWILGKRGQSIEIYLQLRKTKHIDLLTVFVLVVPKRYNATSYIYGTASSKSNKTNQTVISSTQMNVNQGSSNFFSVALCSAVRKFMQL